MTADKVLNLLMSRLGGRTETTLREICLLEMQLAQESLERRGDLLPWFLISEELNAVTPSDGIERRVAIPSGFIREVDEDALLLVASDGGETVLKKADYDALIAKYLRSGQAAQPVAYALQGNYFHLFPIPTEESNLYIRCYKRAETIADSASSEPPWLLHASDLMLNLTGEVVAFEHIKDPELAAKFTAGAAEAWERLRRAETAREEAGRDRQMGES